MCQFGRGPFVEFLLEKRAWEVQHRAPKLNWLELLGLARWCSRQAHLEAAACRAAQQAGHGASMPGGAAGGPTWKPPLSVIIGRWRFMNACRPPAAATTSAPGCSSRW